VHALAIGPDGSWLASAGDDGSVRVWRPADATLLTAFRTDDHLAFICPVPRRPSWLAVGGTKGLYIFEYRD
jgi:WD40 repeat protein